ncbi:MAG: hypothetical protein SF123_07555 [Chloroflexota bacterium]|nr:hypothetical protein [Chloroflexota bacterium]
MSLFRSHRKHMIVALIAIFVMALAVAPAFAQGATPVPLNLPINDIMSSTNTWLSALAPVVTPGFAIGIAIAILGFLGAQLLKAFKGGGNR